jgi:hypothetical protein
VRRLDDRQQALEFRAELDDFAEVGGGKLSDQGFSASGEAHFDPPPIYGRGPALHEVAGGESVDDSDGAVMLEVQAIGQLGDGDELATGKPFDREQGLMLLGRKASRAGRILAKFQKPTQRVPPRRQRFVVLFGQRGVARHGEAKGRRRSDG